ncbi:MAG: ATP-binding protein [Hyphomicrobiaceae bacterium]
MVHHDRRHGNIVIDARLGHNTLTIAVTDDGPGIDPAHHQAILLPFRSLNQRPGSSGMGLAFVNRTVTAIGGRLEVRSCPKDGRGTTFMLFWPKRLNCGGGKGP